MAASREINGSEVRPAYVGRGTMASPAEGYGATHKVEQQNIIDTALSNEVSWKPFTRKKRKKAKK